MKTLAIGERYNAPLWEPNGCVRDSFAVRVVMGFYRTGHRRRFLRSVGIDWDDGVNLLWPHPSPGTWDAVEARRVAGVVLQDVSRYGRVLLFGRRVCDAFGVPFEVGSAHGRFVPLPHPSGLNRMWNSQSTRETVRQVMVETSGPSDLKL